MTDKPISGRFWEAITGHRHYPAAMVSLFLLMLAGCFIGWPITMSDTDLWYHLSGGRYLWQNGAIADQAFFSYITPPKQWYNYYWLFQAVVYGTFEGAGYFGLVALRALLFLSTALGIVLFFVRRREGRAELLIGLALAVCCTMLILNRELLVRPHLFSYLFIVLFLYILEFRIEKAWLLPPLGMLWSNLHGIEYPVMFLIVFAYLAEIYWAEFRKKAVAEAAGRKTKWWLIAVFYTIFLTPGVVELVQTPFSVTFRSAAHQHLYVAELLPFSFRNLFVFAPVTFNGLIASLQNLLILLAAGLFLAGIWKRRLRVSHAILFLGALPLLAKHLRFGYEFILLSLPLLHEGTLQIAATRRLPRRFVDLALPFVLLLLPLLILNDRFGHRPVYPFSESNLPAGVVRFLNRHAAGGRILNEPNTGGYLPWALSPGFRIYMDMQMSLFGDTDFATAHNAFSDPTVFAVFVEKYDPSFISVSLRRDYFRSVVATVPRYVPLFFDQAELLYVNRAHYAALADRYGLKTIDPFRLSGIKYGEMEATTLRQWAAEAERIAAEDPDNFSANQLLCGIEVFRQNYDQALIHAERIIRRHPESSHGYALRADALFGLERYDEAAGLYRQALAMGQTAKNENVYWNLHACLVKLKEYRKAYELLSRYVNPFLPNADPGEIYQLGVSAASVGKIGEAVTFLKIARMKTPPANRGEIEKIDRELRMLETAEP